MQLEYARVPVSELGSGHLRRRIVVDQTGMKITGVLQAFSVVACPCPEVHIQYALVVASGDDGYRLIMDGDETVKLSLDRAGVS